MSVECCILEMVEKPATPGLKYRHYSPHAEVLLLEGDNDAKIIEIVTRAHVFSPTHILDSGSVKLFIIYTLQSYSLSEFFTLLIAFPLAC